MDMIMTSFLRYNKWPSQCIQESIVSGTLLAPPRMTGDADSNGGSITTAANNSHTVSAGEPVFSSIPQITSYLTESAQRGRYQDAQRLASQNHKAKQQDQGQGSKTTITATTATTNADTNATTNATTSGAARAADDTTSRLTAATLFRSSANHLQVYSANAQPIHTTSRSITFDVFNNSSTIVNSGGRINKYLKHHRKRRYGGQSTSNHPSMAAWYRRHNLALIPLPVQPTILPAAAKWPDCTQFQEFTATSLSSNTLSKSTSSSHGPAQFSAHSRSYLSSLGANFALTYP
ncbi:MAG: hypothetical protein J3R72DRAFT_487671 [Linnemannia gamsii]|nr:MAG: hypothetical protein J3R72DRAFT_487671 [Linnemannia gamsii]